jgi:DNA double-strand break repair and V(D)J recombination protein XRCC4
VFNPQSAMSPPEDLRKGLEIVAAVDRGKVTITLRNRIDKIMQKLGSIGLSQDDDVEIQLFDWCGSAIDQRTKLDAQQDSLRSRCATAQATIASLEAKLEELVKAKADHEEELIAKFILLLNEKKLKIRNQQRLLSTAKVDQTKLKQMEGTLVGKGRRAERSRAGKRQAETPAEEAEEQNDSSDAFERMNVDQQDGIVTESQEASPERQTTPETETATESNSEAAESPSKPSPPPPRTKSLEQSKVSKRVSSPARKSSKLRQSQTKSASPPPVRQLPFAKKGAKREKAQGAEPEPENSQTRAGTLNISKSSYSGEETASEDDEL